MGARRADKGCSSSPGRARTTMGADIAGWDATYVLPLAGHAAGAGHAAWATYQSPAAAPALDPWAAGRAAQAAQESPSAPRHFDMGTPGDGGKGGYPYQRDMFIDARSWGDHRKLDVATTFEGFQV